MIFLSLWRCFGKVTCATRRASKLSCVREGLYSPLSVAHAQNNPIILFGYLTCVVGDLLPPPSPAAAARAAGRQQRKLGLKLYYLCKPIKKVGDAGSSFPTCLSHICLVLLVWKRFPIRVCDLLSWNWQELMAHVFFAGSCRGSGPRDSWAPFKGWPKLRGEKELPIWYPGLVLHRSLFGKVSSKHIKHIFW